MPLAPVIVLALRELAHRWGSASLTVVVLIAAIAMPVGLRAVLRESDARAEAAAMAKAEAVGGRMHGLEKELRGMTLRMGFNAVVLSPGQRPDDLHRNGGVPAGSMPEAVGKTLAAKHPETVNHLLPVLQRRLTWPERSLEIVLTGVIGEVYIADPRSQKPLLEAVAAGHCVIGRPLAERLGVKIGDRIVLRGSELLVSGLRPGRGSLDDVTVWTSLGDAQQILGEPGVISAIYLLLCQCDDDGGNAARRELAGLLPDHELLVFSTMSRARGETLSLAAKASQDILAAERTAHAAERDRRVRLGFWLSLGVLSLAACITAALALDQVRNRFPELALLRAVGWSAGSVLRLVLLRAMLVGTAGGLLAWATGIAIARVWAGPQPLLPGWEPLPLGLCVVGAPLFAMLCSLPAALWAASREPAIALGEL